MRIGVKQPLFEDRLQHHPHQGVDQTRHRLRMPTGVKIHPFTCRKIHRQYGCTRTRLHHLGNPQISDIRQRGAKELYGPCLSEEICFTVQTVGKLTHQHRQIKRQQAREEALPQRHQIRQRRNIGGDYIFQAWPLHLDGNMTPVLHCRLVHLGDGGGGQRCFAKRSEQLRQRGTKLRFHHLPNCINALRRQLVVQLLQLIDVGLRQQVTPHGEHLAEFKEGETKFLEGLPHLFRRRPMPLAAQDAQELVTGKHAQYLQKPRRYSPQTAFLRIDQ